ncbi:hypothetical protein [Mycolicibacterium brisbanense]|uniref:Putative transmembrane protein n=1 Tax=Mycolicibacterium brisbanense TaxID=146020 RepID=A0A100VWY4_9MYCO|nr:hypothetical protein [Mycolicibacterium brisbanense]MCV7161547.1 DUF308 domain-containing protein [Mycolicibacterium brisbanense]GAS87479.1 putative transmembrane protein [Mycolicibacterium brisbanense]
MSVHHSSALKSNREQWLKTYYFVRAAVALVWVVVALTVAQHSLALATGWLVLYPFWDAAANLWDASRSGGLVQNRSQMINVAVSLIVTVVAAYVLFTGTASVLPVFGAWATLAGLLQLATAVRRWKAGAQWAMILSGAQSALVGGLFVTQAHTPVVGSVKTLAGYAAMGAIYFLISALWLTVKISRGKSPRVPHDGEARTANR